MTGAPEGSMESGSGEAWNRTCDPWLELLIDISVALRESRKLCQGPDNVACSFKAIDVFHSGSYVLPSRSN